MPDVQTHPQLFDDDIASLTALTLIVNSECRRQNVVNVRISQLTVAVSDNSLSAEATSLSGVADSDTRLR